MLFHGSHKLIKNELIPHVSFDYKPYVYATADIFYALVRAGNFSPENFLMKEEYDGRNFLFVELKDHAFDEAFDTDGYIYYLNGANFHWNRNGAPNEYVSEYPVLIQDTQYIENIKKDIFFAKDRFTIVKNSESDWYWETVNGGKEGYLKRRTERLKKLIKQKNFYNIDNANNL